MQRILGAALLLVAGCATSGGSPGTSPVVPVATVVESADGTSSVSSSFGASAVTTTATVPVSTTTTTVPEVDVDLSELDALFDEVEDALGSLDMNEGEGDLP